MLRIASKLRQVASQAADSGPSSAREYFCVHGGYRTVASVIVTRPPLVFAETPELREYRQFKAAFEKAVVFNQLIRDGKESELVFEPAIEDQEEVVEDDPDKNKTADQEGGDQGEAEGDDA